MEDHHTKEIDDINKQLPSINSELTGAKGRKKRRLKSQKKDLEKRRKKVGKAHDKHVRKDERREDREDRIEIRQDAKNERVEMRTDAKKVAYENGIDPTANALNGVSNIVSSAGNATMGIMGMRNQGRMIGNQSKMIDKARSSDIKSMFNASTDSNSSNMMLLLVAILAFLGFSGGKKKRR